MERELIEKLAQAVRIAEEKGSSTLSRKKILSDAMDKRRIPDDSRGLRVSYEFAVLKKLAEEREQAKELEEKRRRAAENRETKLRERVLAKPTVEGEKETALSLDDKFTDALHSGDISKEDLEKPHFRYRGKEPKDFYFGPPR